MGGGKEGTKQRRQAGRKERRVIRTKEIERITERRDGRREENLGSCRRGRLGLVFWKGSNKEEERGDTKRKVK